MQEQINTYVQACQSCQKSKWKQYKYVHLPPKEAEAHIWDEMCVDLIGPYKIRRKGKPDLVCKCVTMIDPASGWFEIHPYADKRVVTIANVVEQHWFSRYPWPTQLVYDRGNEFLEHEFYSMILQDYGIRGKSITVRNPQTNAIVEQIHQVIGNIIRTFDLEEHYLNEEDPWMGILAATAFAVRSTYHTTLKKTPGQLVFGCDMIFNIQHVANWEFIRQNKQRHIDKNNKAENAKHIPHQYKTGDLVLLLCRTENKYEAPYKGPFSILQVYDNGTVHLKIGAVKDTVNIRRLTPYTSAPAKTDTLNHGGECSMQSTPRRSARVLQPPRA